MIFSATVTIFFPVFQFDSVYNNIQLFLYVNLISVTLLSSFINFNSFVDYLGFSL